MIAIFSDTHRTDGHGLTGRALDAAREASAVIHAGDFGSEATYEAFLEECFRVYGVYGNVDGPALVERLPERRTVEVESVRFAVRHRPDGGLPSLSLYGRSVDADVVVYGHTHRTSLTATDDLLVVNPGSHTQPRGYRPGFVTLTVENGRLVGAIEEPDGTPIESIDHVLDRSD